MEDCSDTFNNTIIITDLLPKLSYTDS